MACEVVVEQTLTPLPKGKKVKNFNLEGGQSATLKTYTDLTHDQITTKQFWKPFDRHAKLRHKIVHFGARVGQVEAQESLAVATQFVDHVEKVRAALR